MAMRSGGGAIETEIVFCERCGVSIPEHEIASSRKASGGRDLCATCIAPGALDAGEADGDLRIYFCENCRVSIAVSDVLQGAARPEGSGYLCSVCTQGSPAERVARRTAVEREMTATASPPGSRARPAHASTPLYFCDACNASIPAASVATGRALVEGGRTWCETCRPRHARSGGGGGGFVPVLAAALLAAGVTAAGFVGWDRMEKARLLDQAASAKSDPLDPMRRDIRAAREDASVARGEVADRADRVEKELERRVEALRADIKAVREASDKGLLLASNSGTDRVTRLEARMEDIEETLVAGLQALANRLDRVAAKAAEGGQPLPPVESAGMAMEEGAPTGAVPPQGLSPEAARTVALLADRTAEGRFAAAIELGKLGEKAVWPHLVGTLQGDDDPFVRRACCRSLGELKAYEAFPALVDALSDGEEYVAKQASIVIKEMAGQDFGYKQNQPKGDRRKVADRARKWWEENAAKLVPREK